MRLWHEQLIPYLPRQQLLGQHRECCALRGNGWGKPHSVVNYVFKHSRMLLVAYHVKIMHEMLRRGYTPDNEWWSRSYRGATLGHEPVTAEDEQTFKLAYARYPVYAEHNDAYLKECVDNLKGKGIDLTECFSF